MTLPPPATSPVVRDPARPGFWAQVLMFGSILRRRVVEDQNFQQAAALAYNTLFSLLPTLVLALLVLSFVSGPIASEPRESARTRPSTTSPALRAEGAATGTASAPATESAGTQAAETEPAAPSSMGQGAQAWLLGQLGFDQIKIEIVRNGKPQQINLAVLIGDRIQRVFKLVRSPGTGAIVLGVLIYGALSLMLVIERAFSAIYRSPKKRPWVRRISLYTSLFVWGPLCVGVSLWLSQYIHQSVGAGVETAAWLAGPLTLLASFIVSWSLLLIVYKLIPETLVRWRSAMWGALVGAILWELGKYGFGIYLRFSVGTRSWYGGIAMVPLFMMWIYLTWHFVLLGLQVAYIHQYFEALSKRIRAAKMYRIPMADIEWVLPLGVLLYRRFKVGGTLAPEEAAEELGLPPDVAALLLGALTQAGIAHLVDAAPLAQNGKKHEGGGGQAYSLARPPEEITAHSLVEAARALCQITETAREESVHHAAGLEHFTQQQNQWKRNYSLPALAGEGPRPQNPLSPPTARPMEPPPRTPHQRLGGSN